MLLINKEKRLYIDAFWVLAGQFVSGLVLLAGIRILTELVSPDVYGQVALFNGFVALGVAVFSYPFICAGMRILPECADSQRYDLLMQQIYYLTTRSIFVAIAIFLSIGGVYCLGSKDNFWLFVLASLLLVVTVRRELGVQLLIGDRQHRNASLWQITDSFIRPLFAIMMVWYVGNHVEWILLGYVLAGVTANLPANCFRRKHEQSENQQAPVIKSKFGQEILAYALPLIPMELIFWINGLGDRYVIGYMMTAADVGLYAATYTIINEAFNRSAMVLLRTFQPVYFQLFSADQRTKSYQTLWTWICCTICLGVLGVVIVDFTKQWLSELLLAKSYHTSVELMTVIAGGCALNALGTVLSQPLLARKQTKLVLLGRTSGVLTAAIAIPVLVTHFGLFGAALANPIYFGVEAFVLGILAKPWRNCQSGFQYQLNNSSIKLTV